MKRWILPLIAVAFAAGCTTIPLEQRPYNPAQRERVKTVGVLLPAAHRSLQVRVVNSVGNNFGPIGAAISEGIAAARKDNFSEDALNAGFDLQKELGDALAKALKASGYKVKDMPLARTPGKFLNGYSKIPGLEGVDAVLDSYIDYRGYFASGPATPYRPTYFLGVRLIKVPEQKLLFGDEIVYNPIGDTGEAITLQAGDEYAFKNYDQLNAEMERAIAGLRVGLAEMAQQIAELLQ